MNRPTPSRLRVCALAIAVSACGGAASSPPEHAGHHAERSDAAAPAGARASEPFRQEHVGLLAQLGEAEGKALAVLSAPEADRAAHVHAVVHFLEHVLAPHAHVEEAVLYPAVDRAVGAPAPFRYTDTMRHDHTVVARTIGELHAFMQAGDLSSAALAAFQAKALALFGLVRAHFEAEEDVLLVVLDARMDRETFVREVMEPSHRWLEQHGHGGGHEHGAPSP